jgi:hypothetical protein
MLAIGVDPTSGIINDKLPMEVQKGFPASQQHRLLNVREFPDRETLLY